jgi:SAM-dependent methyltransferase
MPSLYTALSSDWHLLHRPRLAALDFLAQLAGDTPGRVVDVGAASGDYAALLSDRGHEAFAVDVNRAMYESASARHPALNSVHGDMLEVFDLVRGPLSLAYCIGGTLCELASQNEVRDVVGQMLDLVRPGGCVVVEMPNFDHLGLQAKRLLHEVNSAPDDVRYGDLEDLSHAEGSPALGSVSDDEMRLYLPPVSGYREDGTELRLEQQYVWRSEMRDLVLRWQFDAPGESCGDELPLLELSRASLASALPQAEVSWYGGWDGCGWSTDSPHAIAVLKPV